MVNSVSTSVQEPPVKTLQMFDPDKKKVRKFTNKSEVIDEYLKETNKATDKMFTDAGYGSAAAGTAGLCGRLLYDGIKKGKFKAGKAILAGMFGAITGFFAIAAVEYKTRVKKVTKEFINHSEKTFPLENIFGVKFTDFAKILPDIEEDDA